MKPLKTSRIAGLFVFILLIFFNSHASTLDKQPRVVDGTSTTTKQHPSYTYIVIGRANKYSLCGGTVISNQWILTAAHCVTNKYGKVDTTPNQVFARLNASDTSPTVLSVKQIVVHPNYRFPYNDIALLKLTTKTQNPIAILNDNTNNLVGKTATVIGFGSTTRQKPKEEVTNKLPKQLQQANLPIINRTLCSVASNKKMVLCAGYNDRKNHPDACFGDSGGPLFLNQSGKKTQIGIVSYGRGCGVGIPGGFADVSYLKPFIKRHVTNATFLSDALSIPALFKDSFE